MEKTINISGIEEKHFSAFAKEATITQYDFSQMHMHPDGTVIGDYILRSPSTLSFAQDPAFHINLALGAYEKNAVLIQQGFSPDLYDNARGWASDIHFGEGGFECALTEAQIDNLKKLDFKYIHQWHLKSSPQFNIAEKRFEFLVNGQDLEHLTNVWNLDDNESNMSEMCGLALRSYNDYLVQLKNQYLTIYVKKGEVPRTLFEFRDKAN